MAPASTELRIFLKINGRVGRGAYKLITGESAVLLTVILHGLYLHVDLPVSLFLSIDSSCNKS
jgi:hypothetical protein